MWLRCRVSATSCAASSHVDGHLGGQFATTKGALPVMDILDWLSDPPADRAIHFSNGCGGWTSTSYATLATKVRQIAWRLSESEVGSGDVALVIGQNSIEFIAMFY